jgi:hypothetical protein
LLWFSVQLLRLTINIAKREMIVNIPIKNLQVSLSIQPPALVPTVAGSPMGALHLLVMAAKCLPVFGCHQIGR